MWVPDDGQVRMWQRYWSLREEGGSVTRSARLAGLDRQTARRFEDGNPKSSGVMVRTWLAGGSPTRGGNNWAELAQRDFDVFRGRYFGRVVLPWHRDAAGQVTSRMGGGERRYLVMNVASGAGKTTLVHDLICWLLVRDRRTRILLGARAESQARLYLRRVRRSLERTEPVLADPELRKLGQARDAVATLIGDFGSFRPKEADLWNAEQLVVAGAERSDEKEPSVAAFGSDSAFLGGRYDVIIWDDVVDKRNLNTVEAREKLWEWFTGEAETRLEPGGLLILVGQRMAAFDLYRKVLDVRMADGTPKYELVRYRAHEESLCKDEHGKTAQPWPHGCLLDPQRLPWTFLSQMRATNPTKFRLMMQQENVVADDSLVKPEWILGGTIGSETFPGCVDTTRTVGMVPPVLKGAGWSVITADPSPANFWSVQWWGYHHNLRTRFLLDMFRGRMSGPEFLSWDHMNGRFAGILEEWWQRARDLGFPIQHVVVEGNAAQRFLLQQTDTRRWQVARSVNLVAHQTNRNKADPKYGVHTIGAPYKYGQVSLPWAPSTRHQIQQLVDELIQWPYGETDDCVMAQWFMEYSLPRLAPRQEPAPVLPRPIYIASGVKRGWKVS